MSLNYKTLVSENYKNNPKILLKRKQTNLEKYGTEHCSQNKEILEKMYKTNIVKYGCKSILGTKAHTDNTSKYNTENKEWITKKKKEAWTKNYGIDSYFKTKKFLKDREELWLKKYGTTNINDVNFIRTKFFLDTKIIYQSKLELLFLELARKHNILNKIKRPNFVNYFFDGKKRKYFPDYSIDNLYIEIKSSYTYNKNGKDKYIESKNNCKFEAVKKLGIEFKLLIDKEQIIEYFKENYEY